MDGSAPDKHVAPLTATDISSVFSLADKKQPTAEWGPLRRFAEGDLDGFLVLDPHSSRALYTIARQPSGRYVVLDGAGRDLASGQTMDEALTRWG